MKCTELISNVCRLFCSTEAILALRSISDMTIVKTYWSQLELNMRCMGRSLCYPIH